MSDGLKAPEPAAAPAAAPARRPGSPVAARLLARPEALTARLFSLRAEGLLTGLAPGTAGSRASGLLIGLELAGARGYWLGTRLAVIGNGPLADLYAAALAAQGVTVERGDADWAVLEGLKAARAVQIGGRGA